jgi:Sortase domain
LTNRLLAWVALTVGASAISAGAYGLLSGTGPGQQVTQAGEVPPGDPTQTPSSPTSGQHHRKFPDVPQRRQGGMEPGNTWWGPPGELTVSALGIHAAIRPVRVLPGGSVAIPPDVATVGWVAASGRPGTGTTTLVGHVDDARGHLGVLHKLYGARVGQDVKIATTTGETLLYQVRAVRLYPRNALPPDLFSPTGRPRLALVTCAGTYDRAKGGYKDNLVVWAAPLG